MSSNTATAAQLLAAALARHEVTTIFGQSLPSAAILAAEDLNIRQRDRIGSEVHHHPNPLTVEDEQIVVGFHPFKAVAAPHLLGASTDGVPVQLERRSRDTILGLHRPRSPAWGLGQP